MKNIDWRSDTEFTINGIDFVCVLADYHMHQTTQEKIVLIKSRRSIEIYCERFKNNEPKNIIEFGIFEGGSPILFSLLFGSQKFVGIDKKKPVKGLDEFLKRNPVGEGISIHYQISQDETENIKRIIDNEFGEEDIDLIIDDASHQYELTQRSFEITFPLLRPGGIYVIEDWGWAHWPGFNQWQDAPAMSNLIFKLVMACASSKEVISDIQIYPSHVFITKATAPNLDELKVDNLYRARGKSLNLI